MFWKKETEEDKFNKNLNLLKENKKWLDYNLEYYDLFNSLLLYDNHIYCIEKFELPLITDKINDKLRIVIKNRFWKDKLTCSLYCKFYNEEDMSDYLNQIIKQKHDFKEIRNQLNIFGFEITKIEE